MAQIDNLLGHMQSSHTLRVLLSGGQPMRMETVTGVQLGAVMDVNGLESIVGEVLPAHLHNSWQTGAPLSFIHTTAAGHFSIRAQRVAGVPHVEIIPAPAAARQMPPAHRGSAMPNYPPGTPPIKQGHFGGQNEGTLPPSQPSPHSSSTPTQPYYPGVYPKPYPGPTQVIVVKQGSSFPIWILFVILAVFLLPILFIFGVGTAILAPVAMRANDNAVRTTCLSNLKKLSSAALLYASTHQNRFPQGTTFEQWKPALGTYVTDQTVYVCPADPNDTVKYVLNPKLNNIPVPLGAYAPDLPLFVESKSDHLDGFTVAYCDGHVRWHKEADRPMVQAKIDSFNP